MTERDNTYIQKYGRELEVLEKSFNFAGQDFKYLAYAGDALYSNLFGEAGDYACSE